MEKIYFRDNPKLKILDVISDIPVFCENLKRENINEKQDVLRKIIIDTYTQSSFKNSPEMFLEVAKKGKEEEIEIDIENMKYEFVKIGIIGSKMIEKTPQNYLKLEKKTESILKNAYIFDIIYFYLEEDIKKIIVSEVFKRFFNGIVLQQYFALRFKIKVKNEKLDKIFENESIKNKRSFFMQQFQTWAIYNKIINFIAFEEEEECMYIRFNLLNN